MDASNRYGHLGGFSIPSPGGRYLRSLVRNRHLLYSEKVHRKAYEVQVGTFERLVRKYRERLGYIDKSRLAETLEWSEDYIGRIESVARSVTAAGLKKVLDALELNPRGPKADAFRIAWCLHNDVLSSMAHRAILLPEDAHAPIGRAVVAELRRAGSFHARRITEEDAQLILRQLHSALRSTEASWLGSE